VCVTLRGSEFRPTTGGSEASGKMGNAIGEMLPFAVGVAISPIADRRRRPHARNGRPRRIRPHRLGRRRRTGLPLFRPRRSLSRDPRASKTWMGHNNTVIMAVLLLLIGVKLIGDAIAGFSG
jgi:hypothetical protein